MAQSSADAEIKVTSEAAMAFVTSFYQAINTGAPLDGFYTSSVPRYAGLPPDISANGLAVTSPAAYQALLDTQSPPGVARARYEADSVDAHVINPDFALGSSDPHSSSRLPSLGAAAGAHASLLVQVTGCVRYGTGEVGRGRDAVSQANFNEVFVLVPLEDAIGRNSGRSVRRLVIMSQNFRAL